MFREHAVALIGTIAPVLVWLRDHKGIPRNIELIRFSIELRWIWKLAMEKIVLLRDPEPANLTELDVNRRPSSSRRSRSLGTRSCRVTS